MGKVSVIIPVYNREKYILNCLKNLKLQDEIEDIILVDDGSTDNSLDIMSEESKNDKRIILISQQNKGPSAARKEGLKYATTDRICFIDSDDRVSKNYISELNKTMDKTNSNIVFSKIALHVGNSPIYMMYNTFNPKEGYISIKENKDVLPKLNASFIATMYKRDYAKIEDYSFSANEDIAITALLYEQADTIGFSKKAVYHCYQSDNSTARKYISDGIDFSRISNVLLPLEQLKQNFMNKNLQDEYSKQLETIFIKNIFQRINKIYSMDIDKEAKEKLINYLLNFLTYHYNDWPDNNVLKGSYKEYALGDHLDFKNGLKNIQKINVNITPMDYQEVKENYTKVYK